MNFLAHAWLAGDLAADRVGGVIGDFVKGPLPGQLETPLADGVRLHRAIDSFADRHPAFRRSRARVSGERRRVAGIMVDLFYDHFLACYWSSYVHSLATTMAPPPSLAEFSAQVYRDVGACDLGMLPDGSREILARMRDEDWLTAYADPAAIARTLDRMSRYRLRQPNTLAGAGEELLMAYAGFQEDSFEFLQDAATFAADQRTRRSAVFTV